MDMLTRAQLKRLQKTPLGETANHLTLAMKLAGVTQVQIESATGISQAYVSRIARGLYSRLPGETMRMLASHFGCHIEDLFPAREEQAVAS